MASVPLPDQVDAATVVMRRDSWLTGPANTVLATTDGGQTWNTQATGLTGGLPTLLFALDAQTTWHTNGTGLVATTSGGR
jgi:photosystem II stability/assembly factor-like uncharacterized protein